MNLQLLTPEVQRYLREHVATDPAEMALRKSPFPDVSAQELAQQLDSRKRSRKKLSRWYQTAGIYYPEKLAIEQASSETTASYKANLIPQGARMIDLTGGSGVDTFFFAQRVTSVVHCERNERLSAIAQHNLSLLGATNIKFLVSDGLVYFRAQPDNAFDVAYIDPSRRVENRKVFRLEDGEPNVINAQQELQKKVAMVFIKAAPMLDIDAALAVLENVSEVHIISVENECKELLFVLKRGYLDTPELRAVALQGSEANTFSFRMATEKEAIADYAPPAKYLYEPDAAVLKSGAFKLVGQRYGIHKLHPHTHLYTSDQPISGFIGRVFCIDQVVSYTDFKKGKATHYGNVSTRNFPLKANALRKKHRIREDGTRHLFFCTGSDGTLLVIFASKC